MTVNGAITRLAITITDKGSYNTVQQFFMWPATLMPVTSFSLESVSPLFVSVIPEVMHPDCFYNPNSIHFVQHTATGKIVCMHMLKRAHCTTLLFALILLPVTCDPPHPSPLPEDKCIYVQEELLHQIHTLPLELNQSIT